MALTFTPEFLAKYEVLDPLGEGGMGTVYRGIQRSLDRPVAIKFLSRQLLDEEYLTRFACEAKLAGQVFHSNLVAVIETGFMTDIPFIVFELVEGASLREHVRRAGGQLPVVEALDVARQVAAGLAVAHQIGIIHRDIKPENILIGAKGVKVADFGVAKGAGAPQSHKTRSGVIMGTPAYMSPEQAREQALTTASDMYALGAVLHELIAGALPFQRASTLELLQAIVNEPPPPLPGDVTDEVRALVTAMLAKEPGDRPASMEDLACELARLSALCGGAPWRSGAVSTTGGHGSVTNSGAASHATRPVGTRPLIHGALTEPVASVASVPPATPPAPGVSVRVAALACAVVLLACATGAFAWLQNRREEAARIETVRQEKVAKAAQLAKARASAPPEGRPAPAGWGGFGPRSKRAFRNLMGVSIADEGRKLFLENDQIGLRRDAEIARFACGGTGEAHANRTVLCETWTVVQAGQPVEATTKFREWIEVLRHKPELGKLGILPFQHARIYERLVCEVFHRNRAESLTTAAAVAAPMVGTPVEGLFGAVGDLCAGGSRLAAARSRLSEFRGTKASLFLYAESGIGVLEALAFAAALPAGWDADKETRAQATRALALCEDYLKVWTGANLGPVAAELAVGLSQALGVAREPGSESRGRDPELAGHTRGRMMALAAIARAHLAAGKAGAVLAPDPEY